jgi:hypothetical protein
MFFVPYICALRLGNTEVCLSAPSYFSQTRRDKKKVVKTNNVRLGEATQEKFVNFAPTCMGSSPGQFMSPILPPSEKHEGCDKRIVTTVGSLQKWRHDNAIVIGMGSTLFRPKFVS